MKKFTIVFSLVFGLTLMMHCAGTGGGGISMEPPEEGQSAVVGAILVENDGFENYYRPIMSDIYVLLAAKSTVDGEEQTEGYRVQTNDDGYFILQNVPPGAYVVKGIEFYVGVGQTMRVTAEWEAGRKYYRLSNEELNYFVREWPEEEDSKVIDLGINYFLLDRAPRIANFNTFNALNDQELYLDQSYSMPNPVQYFGENFPESEWF